MLRVMGGPTATGLLGSLRVIPRMTRSKFGVGRHYDRTDKQAFFGPYRQRRAAGRNFHRVMGSIRHSGDLFEHAESALGNELAGTPALLVFGEKNDPFGFADIWRTHFPHAVSRVIDGGNHFPMCDDPDIVATWISDWHATRSGRHTAKRAKAEPPRVHRRGARMVLHPRQVLGLWMLIDAVLAGGPLSNSSGNLTTVDGQLPGSETERVDDLIAEHFGTNGTKAGLLVFESRTLRAD